MSAPKCPLCGQTAYIVETNTNDGKAWWCKCCRRAFPLVVAPELETEAKEEVNK